MSLQDIQSRIHTAEEKAGRAVGSTQLIAVSKVQPNERVESVLNEGHRCFGENRVQEAAGKWPDFATRFDGLDLHLIGPLQTNKARQAMELGHCPKLFIQVNTGEEPQKAGIAPRDADAFVKECRDMDLVIEGLMCIPPAEEEPSLHFSLLRKIAERNGLTGLSMGMSGDFESAVALGATHVRVGSAIFGARAYEI
jgi:uncharacterized pyridoxal phosphate-containing UPF0001 family protein